MKNLERAIELFDNYNKQDPNKITYRDVTYPAEYFYALQLHRWVLKLHAGASEMLLLASRSQHIGRWQSPRENYPAGKAGYHKWRADLAKFHGGIAGSLMFKAGYFEEEIKAVQSIIRKENLQTDIEVQIMEDALCLVFLEFQYEDFLMRHDEEKMTGILKKSWRKMNQAGRDAALTLTYSNQASALLQKALC